MKKYLTVLSILGLSLAMVLFTGCGTTNDDMTQTPPQGRTANEAAPNGNTDNKTAQNGNTENKTAPMTTAEYEKYLTERYNHYFKNEAAGANAGMYNIYNDQFDYTGTYNEFITGYNEYNTKDKANLEALKKDLETNVRKGDPQVDKYNDEVITSLDKAILASNEYGASFAEKTKDYGTYAKDEVVKGLRDIGRVPYEARMEFDKMVTNAKDALGVK